MKGGQNFHEKIQIMEVSIISMKKRIISIMLVVMVALSCITSAFAYVNFQDVLKGAYYYDAVQWAIDNGITNGTSPTTFSPTQNCTRGQIVTFLWRANGSPAPKSMKNPFRDVNSSAHYYKPVLWAVEKGITNGTDATHFSPESVCTRGQIVTFIWRSNGSKQVGNTSKFSDVHSYDYFKNAVAWAVYAGITNGTDSSHFSPNNTCIRADAVTLLYRTNKIYVNDASIYRLLVNVIGLNKAQACGFLAYMKWASGCIPTTIEAGYTWETGARYGLIQWANTSGNVRTSNQGIILSKGNTYYDQPGLRRTNLVNWCNCNGYSYQSAEGQIRFLNYELNKFYSGALGKIKACSNSSSGAVNAAEICLEYIDGCPRSSSFWESTARIFRANATWYWNLL